MTTTPIAAEDVLRTACRDIGIKADGITPLRRHATGVYLLPRPQVVARLSPASKAHAITTSIQLTRWLMTHQFPTVEPLDISQPLLHGPYAITFWRHYPQPGTVPTAGHLGALLKDLHSLPSPPIELPAYRPLESLKDIAGGNGILPPETVSWLLEQINALTAEFSSLSSPLGVGLVHGDAYPGNTVWDGTSVRLGDWDEAAQGPRELDLANTFQGIRFGRTPREIDSFASAYGHDPRSWPGLLTLIKIRDLHTLGSFVRRAAQGDRAAQHQLNHRLQSLRRGDRHARWDIF
ncbi:phosphotransferase family protein [Streptomyces hesseae]|uniref:Phosphotransferase n=1 Tax=Streptomyces hesseae TaxID=3075519 RepID=A0ABU2SZH0_9ACTN|nr:phosphotransferase [Streptomyces sp. DSM 40473]MDT0453769.1 phosphotransferase [Streptomyces sp. DSM 40473]